MIEFNPRNLTMNLNFTNPKMISQDTINDLLYVKINDETLFSDRQGITVT